MASNFDNSVILLLYILFNFAPFAHKGYCWPNVYARMRPGLCPHAPGDFLTHFGALVLQYCALLAQQWFQLL